MSYLDRREALKKEYALWIKKATDNLNRVEENILQSDSRDKVFEKLVSIALSGVMVFLAAPLFALLGLPGGILGSIVVFAIGWSLSKVINKKTFGNERAEKDLQQIEIELLHTKRELCDKLKRRQVRINVKNTTKRDLIFSNALEQIRMLEVMEKKLSSYNSSHLSFKYRERQKKACLSWLACIKNLKKILGT